MLNRLEYQRQYRERNRERLRLVKAAYRAKNRERHREWGRKWYAAHKDRKQAYAAKNRGHIREQAARNRTLNRKRYNDYSTKWYEAHPEAKEAKAARARAQVLTLRLEVIAAYGGCCKCCGKVQKEFLTIHHPNGRENVGHPKRMTGWRLYKWLKNHGFPQDGFELMCFDCNCSLGFWGYCPHQVESH